MRNNSPEDFQKAVTLLLEGKDVFWVAEELNMYPSDVYQLQQYLRGKELEQTGSVMVIHKTHRDGSTSYRKLTQPRKCWLAAMERFRDYPFDV